MDFDSFCVSVFQGSLLVIIDSSEKRNCEGGFRTLEFVCEKRSRNVMFLFS